MVTQSDNAPTDGPLDAPPIPTPDEDGHYICDICRLKIRVGCGGSKNFLQHRKSPACLRAAQKGTALPKASQMKTIHSYFSKAPLGGTSSRQTQGQTTMQNAVLDTVTPKAKTKAAPGSGPPLPTPGQPRRKHLDEHRQAAPRPPEHPKQGPTAHALALLASVTDAAHDLPSLVAEACEDDHIARVVLSGDPEDPSEAWEHLDRALNRLLGFGVEIEEIAQRIRRGPLGMEGLIEYIHRFIVDHSISGDLLEGKLERLLKALDLVKQ